MSSKARIKKKNQLRNLLCRMSFAENDLATLYLLNIVLQTIRKEFWCWTNKEFEMSKLSPKSLEKGYKLKALLSFE